MGEWDESIYLQKEILVWTWRMLSSSYTLSSHPQIFTPRERSRAPQGCWWWWTDRRFFLRSYWLSRTPKTNGQNLFIGLPRWPVSGAVKSANIAQKNIPHLYFSLFAKTWPRLNHILAYLITLLRYKMLSSITFEILNPLIDAMPMKLVYFSINAVKLIDIPHKSSPCWGQLQPHGQSE